VAGQTFVVPTGFEIGLALVPRLPLVYLLAGGTSNEAAVVHHFLYAEHAVLRAVADAVLREAPAVTGVPAWRRWLMYWGRWRFALGAGYGNALIRCDVLSWADQRAGIC